MSVNIKLRGTQYEYYTNLDVVQGVVELNLNSSESVSAVVVKVEGELFLVLAALRTYH